MKQLIVTIVMLSMLIMNVEAIDNKLYFNEEKGHLYYDMKAFDGDAFMTHDEMSPGKVYADELEIKNESQNVYDLYLRVNLVEQDLLSEELVENMYMEIYVDDELVYEGDATGTAYDENGVAYQKLIPLGNYKAGESRELVLKTKIKDEYANTENTNIGSLEWEFFAGYENGIQPIVARPNGGFQYKVIILTIVAIVLALLVVLIYRKKYGVKKSRMRKVNE